MSDVGGSIIATGVLLCLSALFSGLTLGLMGLDQMGLQVVIRSGTRPEASAQERKDAGHAQRIYPFRKRGNLLLCTLLFGNVAVNCLLSIILANLTSGFTGFIVSTMAIVIFGEILPQAICSRHPLAIGSACLPLVWLFVNATFFASYPISILLDLLLGKEIGTIYSRNQLKTLLAEYARSKNSEFGAKETNIMAGALDFEHKTVGSCMTPIEQVFMVDIDDALDFEKIMEIFQSGHSRVPVFQKDADGKKAVVALLFVKELILLDPEDAMPVSTIVHHWFGSDIPIVFDDCKTPVLMNLFKSGRSHMALVKTVVSEDDTDPYYKTVGIITIEDLIEEILQEEILDEQDNLPSGENTRKEEKENIARQVAGGGALPFEHPLLQYLEAKERQEATLPVAEAEAVSSFLRDKFTPLFGTKTISRVNLSQLIKDAPILKRREGDEPLDLYKIGEQTSKFCMVLDGNLQVYAGKEKFSSVKGPWDVFCRNVLEDRKSVELDFTATVLSDKPARILSIDLALYTRYLERGGGAFQEGERVQHVDDPPAGENVPDQRADALCCRDRIGNTNAVWLQQKLSENMVVEEDIEEETSAGPEEENVQASRSLPASPKRRTTDARGAAQLRSADNSPNLTSRQPGRDPDSPYLTSRDAGHEDSPRTPISLMESAEETPLIEALGSVASTGTPPLVSPLERNADA
eukprot:CAMPEP_0180186904 /NCGR_PEP_ID=MMETSP0986-20121125/43239_1 /TAXON_ID=697907 /ORGANISM="non described non described, Strain CCMP2293" /LENGTH=692 /DNA_ID=CAMNT_0022140953 /DNA_START=14 /DNA_END=2093 /DNA_ORIENTATION=+